MVGVYFTGGRGFTSRAVGASFGIQWENNEKISRVTLTRAVAAFLLGRSGLYFAGGRGFPSGGRGLLRGRYRSRLCVTLGFKCVRD